MKREAKRRYDVYRDGEKVDTVYAKNTATAQKEAATKHKGNFQLQFVPKPKIPSRADRRDEATTLLRENATSAREIAEAIESFTGDIPASDVLSLIKSNINRLGVDTDELASLKDEIESWRDSIPENLQGSDKYATLDETANVLDEVVGELESVDVPALDIPEGWETSEDACAKLKKMLAALPEELTQFADTLEEQADNADGAEFPGMMG